MQNQNEFDTHLKNLRGKTIQELQKIRELIANKQKVLKEGMTRIEQNAQSAMKLDSIEAARNGLLTFWGQRQVAEKKIQELKSLTEQLDPNAKLVTPINDLPASSKDMMELFFKLGEGYSNADRSLKSLENLDTLIQGIIAEKKLPENYQSAQLLQVLLEPQPNSAQNGQQATKDEGGLNLKWQFGK